MSHRKRNRLQHKVELSTLLKIVMAKKKLRHATQPYNKEADITVLLAKAALEAVRHCDTAYVREQGKTKNILVKRAETAC